MAWTEAETFSTVFGNKRIKGYLLTADSATLELDTGLTFVDHVAATPQSSTAFSGTFARNVLSAGTSSDGYVAVTGVTSGDDYFLLVVGR